MIRTLGLTALSGLCCLRVEAQSQSVLLDQVQTVATSATGVPVQHTFQVSAAGSYTITLTDVGAQFATNPTPLASLQLALTANDALVGTPIIVEGTGAPTGTGTTPGIGTLTFTAAASGTYTVHIVGAPGSTGPGPISTQVTGSSGTVVESWDDIIQLPGQPLPTDEAVLQQSITVPAGDSGSYTVTLSDLSLPQALGTLELIVLPAGGSPLLELPDTSNSNPMQGTVTLTAGTTYDVIAVGQTASGATGGLFDAVVAPASTATVTTLPTWAWATPVGTTMQVGSSATLAAGTYSLSLADLLFPAQLSEVGVAAVVNGQQAAQVSGSGTGSTSFTITSAQAGASSSGATLQVFGAGTAGTAAPGAGSYAVQVSSQSGGAAAFSAVQGVVTPGGAVNAYTFTTPSTSPLAAGSYTATLTDFQLPSALAVADLAVVQDGAIVGTPIVAAGQVPAALVAGTATFLVFASPSSSGGSLFDVNLVNSSNSQVFDQTQAVGVAFAATTLAIPVTGNYDFTLTDLKWPAAFAGLYAIVTQGGNQIAQFDGGGTVTTQYTQGNYVINVLAQPATSSSPTPNATDAGTYVLNVSEAPAAPTVSLTASPTSVASGGTVQLSWTTTGATSCTASGGGWSGTFTGSQAASGSATSPAITANTTFTLSCTGAGGSTSGTAAVTLSSSSTSSSSSSGKGGGSLDLSTLLALAAALTLRRRGLRA
ncbi:MAG TPA: hypothetical protein VMB48_12045 [Steroidobacteraceae bacterium]|nr:hypothetical protein [Steroidobacteraceae bacterium]